MIRRRGDRSSRTLGSRRRSSSNARGAPCIATSRSSPPSSSARLPNLASQMRTAFASMVSNTGSSSPGELAMTLSTSAVAACCSRASFSSRCSRAVLLLARFAPRGRRRPWPGRRCPRFAAFGHALVTCPIAPATMKETIAAPTITAPRAQPHWPGRAGGRRDAFAASHGFKSGVGQMGQSRRNASRFQGTCVSKVTDARRALRSN